MSSYVLVIKHSGVYRYNKFFQIISFRVTLSAIFTRTKNMREVPVPSRQHLTWSRDSWQDFSSWQDFLCSYGQDLFALARFVISTGGGWGRLEGTEK
jgi:hypothetical protein